jgi:hypothetical protein
MDLFGRKQAELRAELAKEKKISKELGNQLRKEKLKNSEMDNADNEISVDSRQLEKIKKDNSCIFLIHYILLLFLFLYIFYIYTNKSNQKDKAIVLIIYILVIGAFLLVYKHSTKDICNILWGLNVNFRSESRKKIYTKEVIGIGHDFYLVMYQSVIFWIIIVLLGWGYWSTGAKQPLTIINSIISTASLLEIINTSFGSFTKVYNLAAEYFGLYSLHKLKLF